MLSSEQDARAPRRTMLRTGKNAPHRGEPGARKSGRSNSRARTPGGWSVRATAAKTRAPARPPECPAWTRLGSAPGGLGGSAAAMATAAAAGVAAARAEAGLCGASRRGCERRAATEARRLGARGACARGRCGPGPAWGGGGSKGGQLCASGRGPPAPSSVLPPFSSLLPSSASFSLLSLLSVPSSPLSSPLPPFCSLLPSPPPKRFNCLSTGDHPAGCWGAFSARSLTQGPDLRKISH